MARFCPWLGQQMEGVVTPEQSHKMAFSGNKAARVSSGEEDVCPFPPRKAADLQLFCWLIFKQPCVRLPSPMCVLRIWQWKPLVCPPGQTCSSLTPPSPCPNRPYHQPVLLEHHKYIPTAVEYSSNCSSPRTGSTFPTGAINLLYGTFTALRASSTCAPLELWPTGSQI